MKPWLLIDIDGVLNPTLSNRQARRQGCARRHTLGPDGHPYPFWFTPEHGRMLAGMTDVFELAWATTWQYSANLEYGPLIGLRELPVVTFDPDTDGDSKVPGILRFVGDHPFVWLDDEVTEGQERLLDAAHDRHLLIRVDEHTGLQPEHLAVARAWAIDLNGD